MEDGEGDDFMSDAPPPEDVIRDCWAAVDAGGGDDDTAAVSVVITCVHDECTCTCTLSSIYMCFSFLDFGHYVSECECERQANCTGSQCLCLCSLFYGSVVGV